MDVTLPAARSRGVSLIELVVTLAVALVLVSTGIPAWQNLVANNTVISSRALLATSMALARETAIESGRHLTLCPSLDQNQCSGDYTAWHAGAILFVDHNANRQRDAGDTLLRVIGEQPDISIQSSSGRRSIRYAPDGSAWGSNLTLRFCLPDAARYNRTIILYGSGRARFASTLSNGDPVTCI